MKALLPALPLTHTRFNDQSPPPLHLQAVRTKLALADFETEELLREFDGGKLAPEHKMHGTSALASRLTKTSYWHRLQRGAADVVAHEKVRPL